jgi:hypothetical protein
MHQVTARLRQVVLDTTDARRAAEFWRHLLGLVYRPGQEPPPPGEDDPDGRDWLNLRLPDGAPLLAFQQVSELEPATWPEHRVPQQLHLDLTVRSRAELELHTPESRRSAAPFSSTGRTTRRSRFAFTQTPTGTRSASSLPTTRCRYLHS